jgi:hypothetical protein
MSRKPEQDCDARPRAQELSCGEARVRMPWKGSAATFPRLTRSCSAASASARPPPVAYVQLGKGEVAPREVGVRRHDEKPFDRRLRLLEALAADEESEKGKPRRHMAGREGEASLKVRHRFLFPAKGRENMAAALQHIRQVRRDAKHGLASRKCLRIAAQRDEQDWRGSPACRSPLGRRRGSRHSSQALRRGGPSRPARCRGC